VQPSSRTPGPQPRGQAPKPCNPTRGDQGPTPDARTRDPASAPPGSGSSGEVRPAGGAGARRRWNAGPGAPSSFLYSRLSTGSVAPGRGHSLGCRLLNLAQPAALASHQLVVRHSVRCDPAWWVTTIYPAKQKMPGCGRRVWGRSALSSAARSTQYTVYCVHSTQYRVRSTEYRVQSTQYTVY
jgi:hypothetical protein